MATAGVAASSLVSIFRGEVSSKFLKELKPNSQTLQDLDNYSDFSRRIKRLEFIESKAEILGKKADDYFPEHVMRRI